MLVTVSSFQGSDAAAHYPIGLVPRCQCASSRYFRSRYRAPLDPTLETKNASACSRRRVGRSRGDHREMAPDLSVRLLELAVYQAGTPFPEATRLKRPAYVTTTSNPAQDSFWVFVVCFDTQGQPPDKLQVRGLVTRSPQVERGAVRACIPRAIDPGATPRPNRRAVRPG